MKKINKINISDKNNKMNWHIKLMFIFLFCTLVVMLAALIKFYYDVNKENKRIALSIKDAVERSNEYLQYNDNDEDVTLGDLFKGLFD